MTTLKTAFAFVAFAGLGFAQDPPSRVARLSLLQGPVSFQPAGVEDWAGATLNYPLTTGDHLFTDQGARAEIRIGPNSIRLNGQTNFGFFNLDDHLAQIQLTGGSVNLRIRDLSDQDVVEVDTPNGAISLLRTGEYRIDSDVNGNTTTVTVRGGEAEVTANGQSFPVRPNQSAFFTGDGQQQSVQPANPVDDFDRFILSRDQREDQAPPPRYVSQQMIGYEDLDANGTWEPAGEYGPVWRPRVSPGWAPYREGRWAWREPWGWTWIDDAPWGFAPFHYGRWAFVGGGWGWCPGPVVVARPVYAPALVAFVGGNGFSLSIGVGGGGGVGWFPLGPREIYAPAYQVSPAYVRNVNYTNIRVIDNVTVNNIVVNRTVVNNVYINRGAPGGFTAVSRQDFVGSRPVQRAAFQVSQEQIRSAPVAGFSPGIAPQRESVFGRAQQGTVARPPQAVFSRPVIARTAPPAAPIPFAARQQAIQANQGRPLGTRELDSIRSRQGFTAPAPPQVRSAVSPNQGFGRGQNQVPSQPNTGNRFGQPGNNPAPQNRGFGRQPDSQPQTEPNRNAPTQIGNFGRPPQPQVATPAAPRPQTAPAPRPEAVPENRGFGRQPEPQTTPAAPRPQTAPAPRPEAVPENRGFGRQPEPQTTPAAPRPEAVPENRGFSRQPEPQTTPAAPRPQTAPAPRPEAVPRQRTEAPQSAPPRTEAAPENRGFGRQSPPQAAPQATPAARPQPAKAPENENKPKEDRSKKEERPK